MKSHITPSGLELLPLLPLPKCCKSSHPASFSFWVCVCLYLHLRLTLTKDSLAQPMLHRHTRRWLTHIERSEPHFSTCRQQRCPVPESVCSRQKSPFTICSFSCSGWVAKGMWQKRKVRRVRAEKWKSFVYGSVLFLFWCFERWHLIIIWSKYWLVKFIWAPKGHPAHRDENRKGQDSICPSKSLKTPESAVSAGFVLWSWDETQALPHARLVQ